MRPGSRADALQMITPSSILERLDDPKIPETDMNVGLRQWCAYPFTQDVILHRDYIRVTGR